MNKLVAQRKKIDHLDKKIARCFQKRMQCCERIGEYKKKVSYALEDTEREGNVLKNCRKNAPLYQKEITDLYKTVFALSKQRQEKK